LRQRGVTLDNRSFTDSRVSAGLGDCSENRVAIGAFSDAGGVFPVGESDLFVGRAADSLKPYTGEEVSNQAVFRVGVRRAVFKLKALDSESALSGEVIVIAGYIVAVNSVVMPREIEAIYAGVAGAGNGEEVRAAVNDVAVRLRNVGDGYSNRAGA
jgi:hypothetical protein